MTHLPFLPDQQTYGSSYVAGPSTLTCSSWEDVSESELQNSLVDMSSSVPLIPEGMFPSYSTPCCNAHSSSADLGWNYQGTFYQPCDMPSMQSSSVPSDSYSTLPVGSTEFMPSFPRPQMHPDTLELDNSSICSSVIVGSPESLSPQSSFPPHGRPPKDNGPGHYFGEQQRAGAQYATESKVAVHPSATSLDTETNAPSSSSSFLPLVCCGHRFSSQSSFDRHRRDHCKTFPPVEPRRFQCQVHCQKAYSRRCSLKKHLMRVGYDRAVVDGLLRTRYRKGMHRRPNKLCTP